MPLLHIILCKDLYSAFWHIIFYYLNEIENMAHCINYIVSQDRNRIFFSQKKKETVYLSVRTCVSQIKEGGRVVTNV
jgi:hypothetical protein